MPAVVTLKVVSGHAHHKEFRIAERMVCIVGRATDCYPWICHRDCSPCECDSSKRPKISRHHFLLDINPPDIWIRDMGSKNGTFLEPPRERCKGWPIGCIGMRPAHLTAEEAAGLHFDSYPVHDGDEIRLGKKGYVAFRVSIAIPVYCLECGKEIPIEDVHSALWKGGHRCAVCSKRAAQEMRTRPSLPKPRLCSSCKRDVSDEVGPERVGEYTCRKCRADPEKVVERLLSQARQNDPDVVAIQGYEVIKRLDPGEESKGAVFLARHRQTGRQVALKVLLPRVAMGPEAKLKFQRQIMITRALEHPNIVRLLDTGCSQGTFFFAMEYCDGGSLDRLLKQRGKLHWTEALPIIMQVLAGLDYAHTASPIPVRLVDGTLEMVKGAVHRDIKPHSILLARRDDQRLVRIGNFGLAKAFDVAGLSGLTSTAQREGTPDFVPRQQVAGFGYARPEVDVWAAAATLYCMLTGSPPRTFPPGEDPFVVVLETRPVPIRERERSVPRKIANVIDEALQDDPEIEIATAAELKRLLQEAL